MKSTEVTSPPALQTVTMCVYSGYDIGGGFPLGHERGDRTEVTIGSRTVIGNRLDARQLRSFIQRNGALVGTVQDLPRDRDYRAGQKFTYTLPATIKPGDVESVIH